MRRTRRTRAIDEAAGSAGEPATKRGPGGARVPGRATTRLATAGLALVLISLTGFALWSAVRTSRATRDVIVISGLRNAFGTARFALGSEESLEREYRLEPTPAVRSELARTTRGFVDALTYVSQHGDTADQAFISRLTAQHDRYLNLVRQIFAAVDAGQPRRAAALDREGEATFEALEGEVDHAVRHEVAEALAALTALDRLSGNVEVPTPIAFAVGLALLAGFWLIVLGYQRRTARQAADNEHLALHDGLTGLPNRTLLHDRVGQAVRQADRDRAPAALLLIDLDRFKEVNDTLGHHYGDLLLVQVSDRLRGALRDVDTVARLGGDEFAILLPRIVGGDAATQVAEKVSDVLHDPFLVEGLTLDVEASIGIALYPEHAGDGAELLQRADIAMYVAKETHAGFVMFDPRQDQHSPRRLALLGELRRGIDSEQLVLHYQPKVEARSGRILGVEALVRWQHPEHGLLPPADFIPLAERTGLIQPLTRFVLNAALRQCREWLTSGHQVSVAVNVSARRLRDTMFPDEVASLLLTWDVPPASLVIEITESTLMIDPVRAMQVLSRLNTMGVQISIDDFGAGYSSMAYLKTLPVDEIKVDRTFVSHMTGSPSDATIVRSTVDLGRNLGLRVVAEGVEDRATWQALSALGCDAIQGFYVGKPMPAADVSRWLDGARDPASAGAAPTPSSPESGRRRSDG